MTRIKTEQDDEEADRTVQGRVLSIMMTQSHNRRFEDNDDTRRADLRGILSTVIVEGNSSCFKISQVLFDTCSSESFVHPQFVLRTGIKPHVIKPVTFTSDSGKQSICHAKVRFTLWIAGVWGRVEAYVGNTNRERLVRLGMNTLRTFRCRVNTAYGPDAETRIMVAQNELGYRRLQFVVEPDAPDQRTEIVPMSRREGVQWSKNNAKTPMQYAAARQIARYHGRFPWHRR